ncbi:MAG: 3-oxoadipate enol-lactonase [Paracoccaceae bacterium]
MQMVDLGGRCLHVRDEGDPAGAPVVFIHALGTDLRLWDALVARLPDALRLIRFDLRGHGLSDAPEGPYAMGGLVRDAEGVLDALGVRDAVVVGLSIGGLVAQGLAVKRLDQVRALVLSNTACKIGTAQMWQERAATARTEGIEALADATMARWFPKPFRDTPQARAWRNLLVRTPVEGYAGCAAAIGGTDFYATTAALRCPALGIAGSEDGSTPPDMVRETLELIPGSTMALIRGAGHLPCVDQPDTYARHLVDFLASIGHGLEAPLDA